MAPTPQGYADGVVDALMEDFADLAADPAVARVLRGALVKQATDPAERFEWIVDCPSVANWRLKPCQDDRGRVRLACYDPNPSDASRELEEKVNARLAAL